MTQKDIIKTVQEQLAIDLNCQPCDLMNESEQFIFTQVKNNPGRRPFPRNKLHFEMATIGRAVVISASPCILDIVKPMLEGKNHYEGFSMPFVYGHTLCYLPDSTVANSVIKPQGFDYKIVEQDDIPALYKFKGFSNAINYDIHHPRPDILACLALKNGTVVGMAGASSDSAKMWQVGIDVLPEYRNRNLAVYLVSTLTRDILSRGYIPYYSTGISNIASQRVAHRAGYSPAWACSYKGKFDGYDIAPVG